MKDDSINQSKTWHLNPNSIRALLEADDALKLEWDDWSDCWSKSKSMTSIKWIYSRAKCVLLSVKYSEKHHLLSISEAYTRWDSESVDVLLFITRARNVLVKWVSWNRKYLHFTSAPFGTCVSFFAGPQSEAVVSESDQWIFKMGNFLQSFRTIPGDADVKTPPIVALTATEVEIIKTTWKIPNANVSSVWRWWCCGRCVCDALVLLCSRLTQPSWFSTPSSSASPNTNRSSQLSKTNR